MHMLRGAKQFAYGLAYLLIIALVVWWAASPSGGRPEKIETEEEYLPVELVQDPKFFRLDSGKTSLLAEFGNPNPDAEVFFSYKFVVFGKSGKAIGEVRESEFLLPDSEEFSVGFADFSEPIIRVEVDILSETYSPASNLFEGGVSIREAATELEEGKAKITGILKNESLISLSKVKVIGVLGDEFGFQLFAGSTVLEDVQSFGEKEFEISVPVDGKVRENMIATSTRIYVNLE